MDVREKKSHLRTLIREQRKALTEDEINEASEILCSRLLTNSLVKTATVIWGYCAMDNEISMKHILEHVIESGKVLLMPRLEDGEMISYVVESLDDLCPGMYGIMEPTGECERWDGPIDVAFLPCVAVGIQGERLGRGSAYIDRFITGKDISLSVALAYDFQVITGIPMEDHDSKVDAIITPSREIILSTSKRENK